MSYFLAGLDNKVRSGLQGWLIRGNRVHGYLFHIEFHFTKSSIDVIVYRGNVAVISIFRVNEDR